MYQRILLPKHLMRIIRFTAIALVTPAAVIAVTLQAPATTIDFESLSHAGNGATSVASPYVEDGFSLTSTWVVNAHPPISVWGTASSNYAGSTGLFSDVGGTYFTLSRSDGLSFDVASIDLSSVYGSPITTYRLETQFIGKRDDSSLVEHEISVRPFFGFRTYALPGFTNIVSLRWNQAGLEPIVIEPHQFDNIVITPEPCSALSLFLGVIPLTCYRFRR
jgi:hypothetical protein